MAINKTEAFVLKKQDFRETSLIATFYTRDFGKISGILKGIRTDSRKFASTLEIFSLNEIVFYGSRSSTLHLVSQCDVRENFTSIRQNMAKTAIASLIMELTNLLMPIEDKNIALFELARSCLNELVTTHVPEKIMTIFKIKALTISGFQPHFDSCVACRIKIDNQTKFSLNMGGLLCGNCFTRDQKARAIFRGTVASMLHIQKNDFKGTLNLGLNPDIKKELDLVLNSFIQYHLEKDLKSQRVVNTMLLGV